MTSTCDGDEPLGGERQVVGNLNGPGRDGECKALISKPLTHGMDPAESLDGMSPQELGVDR